MTTTVDPFAAINAANSAGSAVKSAEAKAASESSDRFLKLLVTQMQNQDPLNPMDNAQVTSQMAQISTVSGIDKLNTTVAGLNGQFMQMQALQGATLVGRDVTLKGNRLDIANGEGVGGFDIPSAADQVRVEILNGAGRTVDTLQLGAMSAGRHGFSWAAGNVGNDSGYQFRVTATAGAGKLAATPLMRDRVNAVDIAGDGLKLQTDYNGAVAYSDVVAIN